MRQLASFPVYPHIFNAKCQFGSVKGTNSDSLAQKFCFYHLVRKSSKVHRLIWIINFLNKAFQWIRLFFLFYSSHHYTLGVCVPRLLVFDLAFHPLLLHLLFHFFFFYFLFFFNGLGFVILVDLSLHLHRLNVGVEWVYGLSAIFSVVYYSDVEFIRVLIIYSAVLDQKLVSKEQIFATLFS